ncbi:MAG: 6-carboxytetrahydropterin synthase [Chloroflexi bacterium]|nr:MAG: 6-carboxytetrahydropterin synthase [Chloroflexota bacterium]TME03583.1 MAG: 6-carboxytetrahydropterin synthase [Chloroflexota bacterium]TME38453.1 MAG: 6-carboxytetrahydropterin synthase [Chloroflexota bacterium]TME52198.1 MAG: 6-carboxytetrahydropterin synthase [Chloroflexota bacterium]
MTPSLRITRRATFAAAHILCRDDWSDEKNRDVFGACATDHGHNYVIEVTVGGALDAETGMVVNLKHVDAVLRREFVDAVDHRHLNRDVDFLHGVIPTAENVALAAFHRLEPHFKPARLLKVRVIETENNAAEVNAD